MQDTTLVQVGHTAPLSPGPVVVNDASGYGKVYVATADGRILGFTTVGSAPNLIFSLDLKAPGGLVRAAFDTFILDPTGTPNTATPAVAIEASPALGANNWLYVGTRNFSTIFQITFQVIVAINLANAPATAVVWVKQVGSNDDRTLGMIAAPVLDRAGYVYATEFGHHVEQFDARFGTPQRVWTQGKISGKLCQTPAITEDGLLLLAGSGLATPGFAAFAAYRIFGSVSFDESSLWQIDSSQLDDGASAPDFFGAPAIAANGRIYLADTLGRVLRFNGTTPLMEGPWPTLGGGNRHSATPLSYAWNVVQLFPAANVNSAIASINSIDNANRAMGNSYGDYPPDGTGYFGTFWKPLGSTRFSTFQAEATYSSTSGDVVGRNVSTSRALVWPLCIFNTSVAAVTLPLPANVTDFNNIPVTVTSSYASGISEDGAAWGYVYNSSFVTVARWTPDGFGAWLPQAVRPAAGNRAYALSAGTSGWTVGKAKFETGASAPFRAFRLQPLVGSLTAGDDLGTLADTSSGKSLTKSSEALELREDYGIVGRSQNTDNVWRACHVAFNANNANNANNPVITQDAALPGLLAGGAGTTWTSAAYGLNRQGIKVGYAQTTGSVNRAVMWTGETGNTITDLNTLLPVNSGWVLQNAIGISEAGFIIGTGTKSGSTVPFLLYPARNVN